MSTESTAFEQWAGVYFGAERNRLYDTGKSVEAAWNAALDAAVKAAQSASGDAFDNTSTVVDAIERLKEEG